MESVFLGQSQEEDSRDANDSDSSVDSGSTSGPNFNYILNMPLWCLTKEKVDELLKQRDHKVCDGLASCLCRCSVILRHAAHLKGRVKLTTVKGCS